MTSILKITLNNLRSNSHYQFITEVIELIYSIERVRIKIQRQYTALQAASDREDQALKKIRKSSITDEINTANRDRNVIFRGMSDANRAAINHFTPAISAAARRMQIVFDTYGNVSRLPLDEETSALGNLLRELTGNYEGDMELTGLTEWAGELRRRNDLVADLVMMRYVEAASRTPLVMNEVRVETDEAYRVITLCIEALWVMATEEEEKDAFGQCIRMLNLIIEHYNNRMAQSKGRSSSEQETAAGTTSADAPDPTEEPDDEPDDNLPVAGI